MCTIKFNTRVVRCVLVLLCISLSVAGCGMVGGHGSLAAGVKYQAQGKYRAAYIEAKKVLQHNATNGDAWLLLGKASLMRGNPKEALTDLEKAKSNGAPAERWAVPMGRALLVTHQYQKLLATLPAGKSFKPAVKARLETLRGDAHRGLKQSAPAKQAYQAALKLNPKNPRALIGLASLAAQADDPDAAHKYVQQALTVAPKNSESWVGKADRSLQNRDLAGAESAYRKALDLNTLGWLPQDRFVARMKLANLQIQQDQFDKALDNIKTLEKKAPQQPRPHYLHALVLYRQGHLDDAVSQLQLVLKVNPDSVPPQLLMGAVNYAKANYGQAEMYLSNVMGMDSKNVVARKLLALTYFREGRSSRALDTLRPVVPGQPSDAVLLASLQRAVARDAGVPRKASKSKGMPAVASTAATGPFANARKALASGDADKAIHLLKSAPRADNAGEAQRTVLLVRAYVDKQRTDKAVKTAGDQVHKHPQDSGAHLLYGTALVADRHYTKARAQFEQAYKLDAGNLSALMNLGSLDVLQHHYKDAEGHYKAVLHKDPHNAMAMTALGKLAIVQHDHAQAIKWFKQAIAAAPKFTGAYLRLIELYSHGGKFDQAAAIANQLASADPDYPSALNAQGATQLNAGHPRQALKPLEHAVKLAPKVSLYRVNLARAQILLKNTTAAEENLEKVVKADPKQVNATMLLAFMKLHDHDLPAALALAHTLQKQTSTSVAGFSLEGDLYMADKSYAKAAKAYQRGLKTHYVRPLVLKHFVALTADGAKQPEQVLRDWLTKHPRDAAMRMALAQYYMSHAHSAMAATQYEKVLKAYPSNVAALNNLAWLYVGEHNPRGLALAKRAHDLASTSPGIADTYGWALIAAHQSRAALPILEKAAKAAPQVPTIQYHLALAQTHTGDRAGARATLAALTKSGASFPEQKAAQKLYLQLGGAAKGGVHE